jgi:ribosome-associated heat shock protein Hsp15
MLLLAAREGKDGNARFAIDRSYATAGVSDKRDSASVAATLYTETADSIAAGEQHAIERRLARPPGADLGARLTKLERRRLDAPRRGSACGR